MPARYVYVEHSYISRNLLEFKCFLKIFQTANSHLGIIDVVFNLFFILYSVTSIHFRLLFAIIFMEFLLFQFIFFNNSMLPLTQSFHLSYSFHLTTEFQLNTRQKKIGNNIYFNQFLKWLYFCCWNCENVSDRIRSLSNIQQH